MLTELEFLELYMYSLKINKICKHFTFIVGFKKKQKWHSVVLNLELLIYFCKLNRVASQDFELLNSQRKSKLVFYLLIFKKSIVV